MASRIRLWNKEDKYACAEIASVYWYRGSGTNIGAKHAENLEDLICNTRKYA